MSYKNMSQSQPQHSYGTGKLDTTNHSLQEHEQFQHRQQKHHLPPNYPADKHYFWGAYEETPLQKMA
jgi:hypothetical protein